MADDIRITRLPDRSVSRVALDLMYDVREPSILPDDPQKKIEAVLDLYAKCYQAASGNRRLT